MLLPTDIVGTNPATLGQNTNSWGGSYTVQPDPTDNTQVEIGMTGLPVSVGNLLAAKLTPGSVSANYNNANNTLTVIYE